MPNTIVLKGSPPRFEDAAGGAIQPGQLLAFDGSFDLIVHGSADGNAQKMVAVEEDFLGNDVDNSYASGDRVQYVIAQRGDVLYMWLTTSMTVTRGDVLFSAGDGDLQESTLDATIVDDALVGYADEAVTTTGTRARIRVRIA
jgi:hypothetical protein